MNLGKNEKTKIEEITANLSRMLYILDEMPTSLGSIFRKLEEDSEQANTIRAAMIRLREADDLIRTARGRLMNLQQ